MNLEVCKLQAEADSVDSIFCTNFTQGQEEAASYWHVLASIIQTVVANHSMDYPLHCILVEYGCFVLIYEVFIASWEMFMYTWTKETLYSKAMHLIMVLILK